MLEVDGFPEEWVRQANEMDEVWVPSEFNRQGLIRCGVRSSLHVMPLGVDPHHFHPRIVAVPNPRRDFVFLSSFEWGERKQPERPLGGRVEHDGDAELEHSPHGTGDTGLVAFLPSRMCPRRLLAGLCALLAGLLPAGWAAPESAPGSLLIPVGNLGLPPAPWGRTTGSATWLCGPGRWVRSFLSTVTPMCVGVIRTQSPCSANGDNERAIPPSAWACAPRNRSN